MAGLESVVFATVAATSAMIAAVGATLRAWMIGRGGRSENEVSLRVTKANGEVIEVHGQRLAKEDLERLIRLLAEDDQDISPGDSTVSQKGKPDDLD